MNLFHIPRKWLSNTNSLSLFKIILNVEEWGHTMQSRTRQFGIEPESNKQEYKKLFLSSWVKRNKRRLRTSREMKKKKENGCWDTTVRYKGKKEKRRREFGVWLSLISLKVQFSDHLHIGGFHVSINDFMSKGFPYIHWNV